MTQHNLSLLFVSQDYNLVSCSIYVAFVNFDQWRDLWLKTIPNDRFLENFLWQNFLLLKFLLEICDLSYFVPLEISDLGFEP